MHYLLEERGRRIVYLESGNNLALESILWDWYDINLLADNEVSPPQRCLLPFVLFWLGWLCLDSSF